MPSAWPLPEPMLATPTSEPLAPGTHGRLPGGTLIPRRGARLSGQSRPFTRTAPHNGPMSVEYLRRSHVDRP